MQDTERNSVAVIRRFAQCTFIRPESVTSPLRSVPDYSPETVIGMGPPDSPEPDPRSASFRMPRSIPRKTK